MGPVSPEEDEAPPARGSLRNNVPRSCDPERFHLEKSEIASELGKIIRTLPKSGQ